MPKRLAIILSGRAHDVLAKFHAGKAPFSGYVRKAIVDTLAKPQLSKLFKR